MKTADIRKAYLKFFEEKAHTIVQSASLIPAGDPTLLFTNSGMVPFKDCFLGTENRGYARATSCQKSLRISGKHNDLENVGRTARHHTFFEMLGNFSFGDYFKKEAISFAWEFVTEILKLDKERLWVTVFENDDEAAGLWKTLTDVRKERVLRYGEKDNFWAMGETGPCGPCSEIFYYLGDNPDSQSEEEFRYTDGLYVEIWNLVFMQFNREPGGVLKLLPKPSVDTGMGLERVAAVAQGKLANYDSDLLRAIIAKAEECSGLSYDGREYGESKDKQYEIDVAFRVIADHARASVFLIADGILPSSDGRGYVLRRLIRRACRYARALHQKKSPFLFKIAKEVISTMQEAYPALKDKEALILRTIEQEEEKFIGTLDDGLKLLAKELKILELQKQKVFPGSVAFSLHDTYGFPLDLTEDILSKEGYLLDQEGFSLEMEKQRERSRSARGKEVELVLQRSVKPTTSIFVGYENAEYESSVSGIYSEAGALKFAKKGDSVALVVKETPFYAESGGQIGDTGEISSDSSSLEVLDTQKVGRDCIVHICKVLEGEIASGERVRLSIEKERRSRLALNHSATHLLHYALKKVLGAHVQQAGSRVSDRSLRFDFNHGEQITASQIQEIERLVNREISLNHSVETRIMSLDEAKKSGATALFGEKYASDVRVVQIGPNSRELCGGTHTGRSGDIGLLSVFSEGGIASGVRRIEAEVSSIALSAAQKRRELLTRISSELKVSEADLEARVKQIFERTKQLEKELEKYRQKENSAQSDSLSKLAKTTRAGVKVLAQKILVNDPKELRTVADDLKNRLGSACIALASESEGKAIILTAVTDDLTGTFHAGKLIQELAGLMGSRGGGKSDLAQAGGGDPAKIDLALARFEELCLG